MHALPPVPPVLEFMQREGQLDAREAYGSLNMGAGFALFLPQAKVDAALAAARSLGLGAWNAGTVEAGAKQVVIGPLGITFAADELQLRG